MKITTILLFSACLTASAGGLAQKVTLSENNVKLEKVFKEIKKQTGYVFFYDSRVLQGAKRVSVQVRNESVEEVLKETLQGLPLDFSIEQKTITIVQKADYSLNGSQASFASLNVAPLPSAPVSIINGTVKDDKDNPLAAVSVIVKGTHKGTSTNLDGSFSIEANVGDVLEFTRIGYQNYSVTIGKENTISIVMKNAKAKEIEQVVIVGYVPQKKELFTGAVGTVDVTQGMTELPVSSAADLLAGRIAGVNVSTNNGQPSTQSSVSIRTGSSWNSQPVLYVIDGVVRDAGTFQNLAPNEIQNITVLKDGASAAIYGVRSAGGVVVVTTKRGKIGAPTINYTSSYSGDHPTKDASLTNLYQNGLLVNQMYANANSIDPNISAAAPQGTAWSQQELDWAKTLPGQGYNGLKEVWNTPYIMTHGIDISGGSEKVKYFASANYYDQGSFLKAEGYKKWNVRVNVTADITSALQLYAGLAMSNTFTSASTNGIGSNIYQNIRLGFNSVPFYSTQGDRYISNGWGFGNPGAIANGVSGYQHNNYIDPQAIVSLTYKLPYVKGLSFKASYMTDWANTHNKQYSPTVTFWFPAYSGANNHIVDVNDANLTNSFVGYTPNALYSSANWQNNYQLDLQASYTRDFGKNHIDAALVYEAAHTTYSSFWNQTYGFPVYVTDQYWATNSDHNDMWAGGGPDYTTGRAAYVGQVNYTYADKYLLNMSIREDGSMYFAPDERWGWFPAASAGWVMTKEDFLKNNKIITYLKPRASVSLAGNDAVVSGWQWQQIYQQGSSYYFGSSTPSTNVGLKYGSLINPDLTWEKSLNYNLGFDYELIHHLSGSFNYYFIHTYDILGNRQNTLPTTFSRNLPQENYGIINAHGYELTIGWHDRIRSVDWHAILNASYGTNKVIKEDYPVSDLPWQVPVGKTTNYIAGYTGYIIRTQAQLTAWQAANPNYNNPGNGSTAIGLGSMVYVDRSGPNGTSDGVINNYDQTVLYANPNPVNFGLNLGANWKGFTIEAVFTGKLHNPKSFYEMSDYYGGQMYNTKWINESWTPSNPNAPLPMVVPRDYESYSVSNSNSWYQDASFIRLRNLNIGYTFQFKNPLGNAIKSIRLFTSATNLFYISKFKWWDPELNAGSSGVNYPIMRTFSGGINVNL